MGAFLDKPITEKEGSSGTGNGVEWACSHMQGWRVSMEDAHDARISLQDAPDCSFFGVFDGHGGAGIAKHSAANLLDRITESPEWQDGKKSPENIMAAMKTGSLKLDAEMRQLPQVRSGEDHSGTTAVYGVITPTHIIVGNIGDSRSVLASGASTIPMSYDHKPTNPPEQARIEAAGGSVTLSRVNGDLAVSRALGDFSYKLRDDLPDVAQQVSPEPEFQVHERKRDTDETLILCCDGIWDVMTNEEVTAFFRQKHAKGETLLTSCENLLDLCLDKKSRDNMTAVAVRIPKDQ